LPVALWSVSAAVAGGAELTGTNAAQQNVIPQGLRVCPGKTRSHSHADISPLQAIVSLRIADVWCRQMATTT
jgi:hypothetical protein